MFDKTFDKKVLDSGVNIPVAFFVLIFFLLVFVTGPVVAKDKVAKDKVAKENVTKEKMESKTVTSKKVVNECADLIKNKKYYKALELCKTNAKKGDASAQFNLGILYYQGLGVMSDKRIARKWIQKAAENNSAIAQYNLGIMTANGIGSGADLVKAYAWLSLAKKNAYKDAASAHDKMGEELSDKEKQQAAKIVEDFLKKKVAKK